MSLSTFLGNKSKPRIFICYRRSGEGAGFGGRIADKLVEHFGHNQCFRDIENIEKGTDFVESIAKATGLCELLLVVIGPDWLTLKDAHNNPKILDKNDFVRLEVSTALSRNIRIIPVLVGGAKDLTEEQLPEDLKLLARRQSHELSDNRWDFDSDQLIRAIESMGIRGRTREEREVGKRKQKIIATILTTSIVLLLGFAAVNYFNRTGRDEIKGSQQTIQNLDSGSKSTPEEIRIDQGAAQNTSKSVLKRNSDAVVDPTATSDISKNSTLPRMDVSTAKKINYNREKGSIKNILVLASSLEAQAFLTLNESNLGQVFTGDALRNYSLVLTQFRDMGIYNMNILEDQVIGEYNIYYEGNKLLAEVEVSETWSGHSHRTIDQLCLVHQESMEVPQTVFLEKMKDSWYITSTTHHNNATPVTTECGQYNCYLL